MYKVESNMSTLVCQLPTAIISGQGAGGVNHFFQKGTIVRPVTYDSVNQKWLCKYVGGGLPDRDQYVHENDLTNF